MKQNILFSMQTVPLLLMLGVILFVYFKERKAKIFQTRLIDSLSTSDGTNWFRVKLSRPGFFKRRLKLLGCEGSAVLINTPDKVRVVAEFGSGEVVDSSYAKSDLNLQWIGNPGLSSANMHWVSIGKNSDLLMVTADTGLNAVRSRESTADMCRMLVPEFQLPINAKSDFALEKNRASLFVIIMFFMLIAYALIDGVIIGHHELIELGPVKLFMPVMMMLGVAIYLILVRGKVPSRESVTLSLLFVLSLELSAIPVIKRADRFLASDGAKTYDYRLGTDANLLPLHAGPPKLKFSQAKEYWSQFEIGSIHQFELVHGPLGLWQLDHSNLDPKFRAYYENHDKDK